MKTYDNTDSASSGKTKWTREDVASAIVDFESAKGRMSQRQFAREGGIKRKRPCSIGSRGKNPLTHPPNWSSFSKAPVESLLFTGS